MLVQAHQGAVLERERLRALFESAKPLDEAGDGEAVPEAAEPSGTPRRRGRVRPARRPP